MADRMEILEKGGNVGVLDRVQVLAFSDFASVGYRSPSLQE